MTSEDYRKSKELLSGSDLYGFAKRMCEKYEINPEKDFPQTTSSEILKSAARRHMYIETVGDLFRRAIYLSATDLEILRISEYYLVVFDSIEKSLDYKGCREALNIPSLEKKYSRNEFLSLETDFEELKSIIDRDNDYYGVKIKNEDNPAQL